jgi:hypothetical protein
MGLRGGEQEKNKNAKFQEKEDNAAAAAKEEDQVGYRMRLIEGGFQR